MRAGRLLIVIILIAFLAACSENTKVGSEELLNVKEAEQKKRLGEILKSPAAEGAEAGEKEGALGAPSPTPKEEVKVQTQAPPLEIALINESPYYDPGPNIQVAGGTIMKITNKDDKTRRFRTSDGSYDSGDIAPGKVVELPARFKGEFSLEDPNVPFATGVLQVY